MKLYSIARWDELYENNRSRKIKDLSWVPIRNKLDGEAFTTIMAHPEGAVIFTGFILMVEIASRCTPRGTLVKGNGDAHNVTSMAVKCRCPRTWFEIAVDYLEKETDWLAVKIVTDERHSSALITSPERQAGDEEGRNGTEGKEGRNGDPTNHLGLSETIQSLEAMESGYSVEEVTRAHLSFESTAVNGYWFVGNRQVTDWRSAISTRILDGRKWGRKSKPKGLGFQP